MSKEDLINQIERSINLYKRFASPDYPELNIYAAQYLDVLIKYFNDADKQYSVVYSDINKLSVVNEKFGKEIGDEVLYTLLSIFTSSLPNCPTIRVGGDEFITFVSNATKAEVEKALIIPEMTMIRGSSIAFDVEDSSSGSVEQIIELAEQNVNTQKQLRKKDTINQLENNKKISDLCIPDELDEEQVKKWEILNQKINVLVDNHLRDVRPSNIRFKYTPEHIRKDSKSFVFAFANLLQKASNGGIEAKEKNKEIDPIAYTSAENNFFNMSNEIALIMHSLFKGENVDLHALSDEQLDTLKNAIDTLGKSFTKNPHSDLFNKPYYKLFLADKLAHSKQTYQAIYFSISGIRPSNTAYGHAATDAKIEKTSKLLKDAIYKKLDYNSIAFSFDKKDRFLIDQGGGNFLLLVPNNMKLKSKEIKEIENEVNSQCTNEPDSSLRIASAKKNHLNTKTIPFFVNSMPGNFPTPVEWFRIINQIVKNKFNKTRLIADSSVSKDMSNFEPFVELSYRLKSDCNNNKDKIKVDNLDKNISQNSIEAISKDCISYFYNEIPDSDSINVQRMFLTNVMQALANYEANINIENGKALQKKLDSRKIFHKKSKNDEAKALITREEEKKAFMDRNKSTFITRQESADKGKVFIQDEEKGYIQMEERF